MRTALRGRSRYVATVAHGDSHKCLIGVLLTLIVGTTLGAFCVIPYVLVLGTIRSR